MFFFTSFSFSCSRNRGRWIVEVISAGTDGVLTGGLLKLLGAASTGTAGETFLLRGHLSVSGALKLGVNFIDTADA